MSGRLRNLSAAGAYLFALPLSFLPGLGLWCWAKDRDAWLEMHGRRAAGFNLAILCGCILLAPGVGIAEWLASLTGLLEAHYSATVSHAGGPATSQSLLFYWSAIFSSPATVGLFMLGAASLFFNILSAWLASRGAGASSGQAPLGRCESAVVNRTTNQMSPPRYAAVALVFYLVMGLLLLVPQHFDIRHELIANGATFPSDPSFYLWSLAWWPWAIGHGLNPLYSRLVWAPVGQNLLWAASIPSLALPLTPVTRVFGPILSYNVLALLSPVLGAWTAYLLCRQITGKFWPAVFGGWLFGFSSYEFTQLGGHVNLFVTVVLPLAVWLYLLRLANSLPRWWYVGLVALLGVFQFGVSTEMLATAVPFGLLVALFAGILPRDAETRRRCRRCLLDTLNGLVLAGILLSPCFYYLFSGHYVHGPHGMAAKMSADPINFLIPTPITWLGGTLAAPLSARFTGGGKFEHGSYLGVPLIIILMLFSREFRRIANARLLIFLLAAFTLFSWGPWLQVFRTTMPVMLPWWLPAHLPVFERILPIRLAIYVSLVAAVMGAWWLAESRSRWRWRFLWSSLAIVFLWPSVFSSQWVHRMHDPAFFTRPMVSRCLSRGATVVVLPYGYCGYSMWWQAEANFYFAMAGGYTGIEKPQRFSRYPPVAAFYAGQTADNHYPVELRRFIQAFNIQAFIIADNSRYSFLSLVTPLHVKPLHVGGVWLYRLGGRVTRHSGPCCEPHFAPGGGWGIQGVSRRGNGEAKLR